MKTDEKTRARRRRYYERHREEILAQERERRRQCSPLERAVALGPEAVAALRKRNAEKQRAWRESRAKAAGRAYHRGGSGTSPDKLIAPIPPHAIPYEARQRHAELRWLIDQAGAVAVRRGRRKSHARRDFAVWNAAAASLPARPIAAEWQDWLAALGRGAHGGPALSAGRMADVYYRCKSLYLAGRLLGMEVRNPFAEIEEPRSADFPAAFSWRATIAGYPRLLAATPDWRERAFFTTLRFTGLRVNEVLGLRREHVLVLPGGRVELQITTQRPYRTAAHVGAMTSLIDRPLKNERQRRILPVVNAELVAALLRARRETPSKVPTLGADHRPTMMESPYLFPFSAYRLAALATHLHALIPELPRGVGWHAFRHAFAAEVRLMAGATVDELAQWLGHSSTLVTYTYLRTLLGEQPDLGDFAARAAAAQLQRPVQAAPAPDNTIAWPGARPTR